LQTASLERSGLKLSATLILLYWLFLRVIGMQGCTVADSSMTGVAGARLMVKFSSPEIAREQLKTATPLCGAVLPLAANTLESS
jgi:hypothetical protein